MAKATLDIRSLARVHAPSAIKALASIVNQKSAPPAARVAAARELLDRGFGKAPLMLEGGNPQWTLVVTGVPRDEDDALLAPTIDVTPIEIHQQNQLVEHSRTEGPSAAEPIEDDANHSGHEKEDPPP